MGGAVLKAQSASGAKHVVCDVRVRALLVAGGFEYVLLRAKAHTLHAADTVVPVDVNRGLVSHKARWRTIDHGCLHLC